MGTGSVFTLIIPAGVIVSDQPKLNDEHYHVNSEPTKPKRTPKYSGRVLIAEDAPANQKLIMILLKKAGIKAVMTENGKQVLAAALASPFDLIIMDMQMPVMNGYEATEELKRKGITTPIVALTANAMTGDKEKCLEAGCDGYLSKPLSVKKLHKVLAKYLTAENTECITNTQYESVHSWQDASI